ncbi:PREDICTED: piggyBac transposable element-derived protein 4-like isoform X1 [Vollenhovia emeryi]|uniref:piggyBac transposable element-derived protein 4-like isoform X1 n=1 Tax=Vollenhovia emeryi TaxID=411798 RepID=UPI0005F3DBDE|nr:PREDICTED: piggyBac transposable element-derived protein 4-like isoform X1 [Vollenhovia emeryi]
MVNIISRYTNKKAASVYTAFNEAHPDSQREWKPITVQEMYSFIAILICSGVNNSNTDHISDMWNPISYPLYRATMGNNRFRNIMRYIRFDDANTRQQGVREDKAAPIRDIWTMLNANLSQMYKPTENLTIDEQLYPFRGRTKFTQYIPSKPAKYGIKIWWICDAENAYPLRGIIYTGKTGNVREKYQGERVVKELAIAYKVGSSRNICMDNYFTTLPLAKHLLSWNLTLVGTLKKNKPYVPSVMAPYK